MNKNKIITFFGGEAKTGTTMITQSVAEALTKRGNKVLVIFASCEHHDMFIPASKTKDAPTLEYIKGFIPQKNDIKKLIQTHNGYDYILGTDKLASVLFFDEDCLVGIADKMEKDYDNIIIDGGHNCHFPLPTSSLYAAGRRYYVIVPSNRSVDRLENLKWLIDNTFANKKTRRLNREVSTSGDEIIVNKYLENSAVTSDLIANKFGMKVFTVPKMQNGSFPETTNKTLYNNNNKEFVSAINEIANEL